MIPPPPADKGNVGFPTIPKIAQDGYPVDVILPADFEGANRDLLVCRGLATHGGEVSKCRICQAMLHDRGQLLSHLIKIHNTEHPYKCTKCENTWKTARELSRHMFLHATKPERLWPDCPAEFRSPSGLILPWECGRSPANPVDKKICGLGDCQM